MRKGRSHHLLKEAINRKEKDLVKKQEVENHRLLESIPDLTGKIEDLKKELVEKDEKIEQYMGDVDILRDLYNRGIIDLNGNLIN